MTKKENTITVRQVQSHLLCMATETRDILEKHQIPYFITYGTLLGAIRHQGFIPWDDDFDFCIFEDRYEEAITILREELPALYFVEDEHSEPLFFHGWARVKDRTTEVDFTLYPQDGLYQNHGLAIDLFKAYLRNESEVEKFRIIKHIEYLRRKYNKGIISEDIFNKKELELNEKINQLNEDEIGNAKKVYMCPLIYDDRIYPKELFPLKRYSFEHTYFYGPNNAHVFLQRCYGDYMMLPPEEKRHPHYSKVMLITGNSE